MRILGRYIYSKYCKTCIETFEKQIFSLENENMKLKKQQINADTLSKILLSYQHIINIQKIENTICIIAVNLLSRYDHKLNELDLYVLTSQNNYSEPVMTMFAEFKYDTYSNNSIEIVDLFGIPNKGYGSFLMKTFLKYIQAYKPKYVYGELSEIDERDTQNKLRRNHFYKKFGFQIKNRKIFLDLNK